MTKITLLNDGGYRDMEGVSFPVEVEATLSEIGHMYYVTYSELLRIGANKNSYYCSYNSDKWSFCLYSECVVVVKTDVEEEKVNINILKEK